MAVGFVLVIFGVHMNMSFIFKVKILMLIEWSYKSPLIILTIELMIFILWVCIPISLEHVLGGGSDLFK